MLYLHRLLKPKMNLITQIIIQHDDIKSCQSRIRHSNSEQLSGKLDYRMSNLTFNIFQTILQNKICSAVRGKTIISAIYNGAIHDMAIHDGDFYCYTRNPLGHRNLHPGEISCYKHKLMQIHSLLSYAVGMTRET